MSFKLSSWTILFSAFLFFVSLEASAQSNCSNLSNRTNSNTGKNHVFGNQSFGQSFKADPSCLNGSKLTSFSFWCQGNSSTKFDFAVYEGEVIPSASGPAPLYEEEGLKRAPTNHKGIIKVDLKTPVSLSAGDMYTVVISMAKSGGGNMVAHTSPKASGVDGKVFFHKSASDSKFYADHDLKYELGVSGSDIVIQSATYGASGRMLSAADSEKLKGILQDMVDNGTESFMVNNQLLLYDHGLRDPASGRQKTLTVKYTKAGVAKTNAKVEKQTFTF